MPNQTDRRSAARYQLSYGLLLLTLVPCVVLLAMGLAAGRREWVASGQLQEKLKPLRAAGLPLGNATMSQRFRNVASTEGTAAWSRISMLCNSFRWQTVDLLPIVGAQELPATIDPDTPWEDDERVGEYLAAIKPVLNLIHAAADVSKPVWQPIEFRGIQTDLTPLQNARSISRILRLEAEHALFHRQADRALQAIDGLQANAAAYDWRLFLVGELVHLALYQLYLDTIGRSLSVDVWNQEQINSLMTRLQAPYPVTQRWRECLATEQLMVIATLENNATAVRPLANLMGGGVARRLPLWFTPQARLELYNTYDELQSLADGGAEQLSTRARTWDREFTQKTGVDGLSLAGLFLPATQQFAAALNRASDKRKMALTAVAIKYFKLKHERWPEKLGELVQVGLPQTDWTLREQGALGYEITETGTEVFCYSADQSEQQPSNPTAIQREAGVAYETIPIQ